MTGGPGLAVREKWEGGDSRLGLGPRGGRSGTRRGEKDGPSVAEFQVERIFFLIIFQTHF